MPRTVDALMDRHDRGLRGISGTILFCLIFVLLLPIPLRGHHSFSTIFDANTPVTLRGTITKMMWVNPHSWLNMDVPNADGTVENWAVEFSSPGSLYRRGWKTRDLFVGTDIVVEGYHARDKSPTAAAITVTLPDGRSLFAGSTGTGAPEPER